MQNQHCLTVGHEPTREHKRDPRLTPYPHYNEDITIKFWPE